MADTNELEEEEMVRKRARSIARKIYSKYLPSYLRYRWKGGKGKWYQDWLKRQLNLLVISEVYNDPCRLAELERLQERIVLIFGLFATCFRVLDYFGMHLRAQTLGQYEFWPEDERLLATLCRRLLKSNKEGLEITPDFPLRYLVEGIRGVAEESGR